MKTSKNVEYAPGVAFFQPFHPCAIYVLYIALVIALDSAIFKNFSSMHDPKVWSSGAIKWITLRVKKKKKLEDEEYNSC